MKVATKVSTKISLKYRPLAFGFLKKFELSPRKTATLEGMIKKEFFKTNPQHYICEIQLHSNLYFPLFLAFLK
jgi:hypothetical protein